VGNTYFLLDYIDVYGFTCVVSCVVDVDENYCGYEGYEDEWRVALCYLGQALYRQLDLGFYIVGMIYHKP
jgi:hypothetical protein